MRFILIRYHPMRWKIHNLNSNEQSSGNVALLVGLLIVLIIKNNRNCGILLSWLQTVLHSRKTKKKTKRYSRNTSVSRDLYKMHLIRFKTCEDVISTDLVWEKGVSIVVILANSAHSIIFVNYFLFDLWNTWIHWKAVDGDQKAYSQISFELSCPAHGSKN